MIIAEISRNGIPLAYIFLLNVDILPLENSIERKCRWRSVNAIAEAIWFSNQNSDLKFLKNSSQEILKNFDAIFKIPTGSYKTKKNCIWCFSHQKYANGSRILQGLFHKLSQIFVWKTKIFWVCFDLEENKIECQCQFWCVL